MVAERRGDDRRLLQEFEERAHGDEPDGHDDALVHPGAPGETGSEVAAEDHGEQRRNADHTAVDGAG